MLRTFASCLFACLLSLAFAPAVRAQTTVFGIDQGGGSQFYQSEASDFVNEWSAVGTGTGSNIFAMDFDPTGTTLWAIDYDTSDYGTIDLTTGVFTSQGPTSLPPQSVIALTCQPNGSWFAFTRAGSNMNMYAGDVTTGGLTLYNFLFGHVMSDIAYANEFKLVGISATDGHLYNIQPLFGDLTPIMDLGAVPGLNHGLDFDWRDNTLWVSVEKANGTGELLSIRGATESIVTVQSTTALGSALSITVQTPFVGMVEGSLFCDPIATNSTGLQTTLSAALPVGTRDLHLEAVQGPPGDFAYLLVSTAQNDPGIPLGNSRLCLDFRGTNQIGRYNQGSGPLNSLGGFNLYGRYQGGAGNSSIPSGFDIPQSLPFAGYPTIMSGETLHFQLWHRDFSSSYLSNGVSVTFQ